ncbi:MAG: alkaline phosphatase family protein [Planctomycetota bacterium]|nr:alkaline phosphatase family protein [Planctomycetota bacterium]
MFNIAKDPNETTNLAETQPDKLKELRARYDALAGQAVPPKVAPAVPGFRSPSFAQPDHAGHKHGEKSQEYGDAIKEDDVWTGKILTTLREQGLAEKTPVYVVVDHGFNLGESGHRYAPFVFLATNDKLVNRNGTREDIAPTVLKRFGVDLTKIQPSLDGIPLDEPAPERKAPTENPNPRPGLARQTVSQG